MQEATGSNPVFSTTLNFVLKITLPKENSIELAYVIQVLVQDSLGVSFEIINDNANTEVFFEYDGKHIVFKQDYFKRDYIHLHENEALPKELVSFNYENLNVSTLYGQPKVVYEGNRKDVYLDIFGSTYFLLTQWESTIMKGDHLGRYKFSGSTIEKLGIYKRPLVNEYIDFIKLLLSQLGVQSSSRIYSPIFTCDVDSITKYSSIRNLLGGFRHRGLSYSIYKEYKASRENKANDVYYSFDYLFKHIEDKGISSIFYFMSEVSDKKYDTMDYSLEEPLISRLFKKIKDNKFSLGLHPNIDSWKSLASIQKQRSELVKFSQQEVKHVRQHYLRYDVNTTWSIFQEMQFKTDSSMQFKEGVGFANGICIPFFLFDLKNRSVTDVLEIPLIAMKKKDYVKNVEEQYNIFKEVIDPAKKHKGNFSILFHNADLETENEKRLFEEVMDLL